MCTVNNPSDRKKDKGGVSALRTPQHMLPASEPSPKMHWCGILKAHNTHFQTLCEHHWLTCVHSPSCTPYIFPPLGCSTRHKAFPRAFKLHWNLGLGDDGAKNYHASITPRADKRRGMGMSIARGAWGQDEVIVARRGADMVVGKRKGCR